LFQSDWSRPSGLPDSESLIGIPESASFLPGQFARMRKNPVRRLERILARRVREVADAKGMPASHLADRAGVSRSLLWEVFSLTASVSLETVQKLAEALDLEDPLELLRGSPAPARRRPKIAGAKKAATRKA
jgi:DNA-binding phage protein